MNAQHRVILFLTVLLLAGLACTLPATEPQAEPAAEDPALFNTAVALTAASLSGSGSSAAPAQETAVVPQIPAARSTSITAAATAPENAGGDVYAPDPLGPVWSGLWFASRTCYDLDALHPAEDGSCDVMLDGNGILTPENGALMSGDGYTAAPSLNTCRSASLSPDALAPLTDLYLCFQTNSGSHGFFVLRDDQLAAAGGFMIDAYLFP